MDFDELAEDRQFRTRVRVWLEERFPLLRTDMPSEPFAVDRTAEQLLAARQAQADLANAGLAGLVWPKEFGGQGARLMQKVIFDEVASAYDVPFVLFAPGVELIGPTIIVHGTKAQQERYLKPILRGEDMWCQLLSEPGSGSDLASVRTQAKLDGDEWVVTGQKVWTTGAHYADLGVMLARTDPTQPKHGGLTYFILDMRNPGVTVRPLRQSTGDTDFNEVFLDEVRIPKDRVLGDVNDGWNVTRTHLMNERTAPSADAGFTTSQLISFARAATIGGGPATEDPTVRLALADVHIRSEILRFVRFRVLTAITHDRAPGPEGSIAKVMTAQLLTRVGDLAMRLQAAKGTAQFDDPSAERAWQKLFLSAPAMHILGGTDEIQRNIIAERTLGLPRDADPWTKRPFEDMPRSAEEWQRISAAP